MTVSDPLLFDTNILVYAHNQDSPFHNKSLSLVKGVLAGQLRGILTQQNLLEFYSIITDQRRITKPLSPLKAQEVFEDYLKLPFRIILPNQETIKILSMFCRKNKIKNGQVFDAYLVATMLSHQVKNIVTANTKDFKLYTEIKVWGIEDF